MRANIDQIITFPRAKRRVLRDTDGKGKATLHTRAGLTHWYYPSGGTGWNEHKWEQINLIVVRQTNRKKNVSKLRQAASLESRYP
jgi:hypothetical protein